VTRFYVRRDVESRPFLLPLRALAMERYCRRMASVCRPRMTLTHSTTSVYQQRDLAVKCSGLNDLPLSVSEFRLIIDSDSFPVDTESQPLDSFMAVRCTLSF